MTANKVLYCKNHADFELYIMDFELKLINWNTVKLYDFWLFTEHNFDNIFEILIFNLFKCIVVSSVFLVHFSMFLLVLIILS